jgi:hypothetical protein
MVAQEVALLAWWWLVSCDRSEPDKQVDADRDGYAASEDCDDTEPAIHPGADELCDGLDQDCDGAEDDDVVAPAENPCRQAGVCEDGTTVSCDQGAWTCLYSAPAWEEHEASCDGLDNDCDGAVDEELAPDTSG